MAAYTPEFQPQSSPPEEVFILADDAANVAVEGKMMNIEDKEQGPEEVTFKELRRGLRAEVLADGVKTKYYYYNDGWYSEAQMRSDHIIGKGHANKRISGIIMEAYRKYRDESAVINKNTETNKEFGQSLYEENQRDIDAIEMGHKGRGTV